MTEPSERASCGAVEDARLSKYLGVVVPRPTPRVVKVIEGEIVDAARSVRVATVGLAALVPCIASVEPTAAPPLMRGTAAMEVVKEGDVPNTATPVPVSSVRELRSEAEAALVTSPLSAAENTARVAARLSIVRPRVIVEVAAPTTESFCRVVEPVVPFAMKMN